MKIFVTGITGFLGKSFLPKLLEKISTSDQVFLLVRKKQKLSDTRITQLVGDLNNIENFEKELIECDYIYHIAANAVFGDTSDYESENFVPTKKIVDIVKNSPNLKNFIYISTIGAFDRDKKDRCVKPIDVNSTPNPRSAYGKSKLKAESYIKESKIRYTIIRPTWIYGKDMRANSHINKFVELVYDKNFLIMFNFPGKVSVVYVEDLAQALANAINNNVILNKEYFVSAENVKLGDIFKIIYKKLHKKELNQITLPQFSFFFSHIHWLLPISISNLFINYLCALDESFWNDFNITKRTKIEEGIDDVIRFNAKVSGVYVITGANSGIGFALAQILDKEGKKLILIDKNIDNLHIFHKHKVIKRDLSEFVDNVDMLNELLSEKIYCLINNAGIGLKGNFEQLKEEDIKKIVYVNALAPVLLTRKLIYTLIKNEGVVVNVISNIAFNPLPGMSLYSSTKSFLLNWSESITYELKKTNTVITFAPSGTYTNFQKNCGVKILNEGKGLLTADFVAIKIIEAIKKKKQFVMLGLSTKILLLFSKFLPRKININLWGKLFEKLR